MKVTKRISDGIEFISKVLAALFIAAITGVLTYQVILRIVFNSGLSWSVEFSNYAVIWAVMLIANVLIKNNEMINVDFLDDFFPENFKKVRDIAYRFVFTIMLFIMLYYGWKLALGSFHKSTPALGISKFYPYLAIPVGALLMIYQYFYQIILNIKKGGE